MLSTLCIVYEYKYTYQTNPGFLEGTWNKTGDVGSIFGLPEYAKNVTDVGMVYMWNYAEVNPVMPSWYMSTIDLTEAINGVNFYQYIYYP